MQAIELTPEQSSALDKSGIIQGDEFILMRPAAFRELLGFESDDELREALRPALEDIEQGRIAELNIDEFVARMRHSHPVRQ